MGGFSNAHSIQTYTNTFVFNAFWDGRHIAFSIYWAWIHLKWNFMGISKCNIYIETVCLSEFFLLLFSLCRKIYHFYSRILCVMTKKKPNRGFMFFFLHSNFWFFQFAIFCVEVSRFFEVSLSVSLSLSHLHIMR